jgi:hypothetical protein
MIFLSSVSRPHLEHPVSNNAFFEFCLFAELFEFEPCSALWATAGNPNFLCADTKDVKLGSRGSG